MGVFAVPYDFADKCSDRGAFLLNAVFLDILTHSRKQLTDKVKFNFCEIVLLHDCFKLGKAFFQALAPFVQFVNLLHDIFFSICTLRLSKRDNECLYIFFVFLNL